MVRKLLFDAIVDQLQERLHIAKYTKSTLIHISHTLEDAILRHQIPAMIFTGFQESGHWYKEAHHYLQLAEVASQIIIFAGKPLSLDPNSNILQIRLSDHDPFKQEWFLLILSDHYWVCLCAKDDGLQDVDDVLRSFDTIITFEPDVIRSVLAILEDILQVYVPELAPQLRHDYQQYDLNDINLSLLSNITTEMLSFEEQLLDKIRKNYFQLEHQRQMNELLMRSTQVLFMIVSEDHKVLNSNLRLLTGIDAPPDYFENQIAQSTPIEQNPYIAEILSNMASLADGDTWESNYPMNESSIYIEWSKRSIPPSPGNETTLYIITGQDITNHHLMETTHNQQAQLSAEIRAQQELGELRERIMTTIMHEFRTPLSTILTSTELLERYIRDIPELKDKPHLGRIKNQIEHLTGMLDDIGSLKLANEVYTQRELVEIELLSFIESEIQQIKRLFAKKRDIQFFKKMDTVYFRCDVELLAYVIHNLLKNALMYSPEDTSVEISAERHNSRFIKIIVQDYGIGIPEVDQQRIFEAFYRSPNVQNITGTGLGLPLVKQCISLLEGKISFKSIPGNTRFEIIIPLNQQILSEAD